VHFESPWRLLTLAPFAAFVLWLLIGLHKRTPIPFLSLWPDDPGAPKRERRVHLPPISIMLILLAMLLALVGLANPVIGKKVAPLPVETNPPPTITHAALRGGQLQIDLSAPSQKPLELVLSYDSTRESRTLGEGQRYFLDFKPEPEEIQLIFGSSIAILKRQGAFPKIQSDAPLSFSVDRVISSYENARKPSENSPVLKISASLQPDESGILPGKTENATGELQIVDHPITANVHAWPSTASDAPQGWTPLVKRGEKTLLAVRESPSVRQAWVAMDFALWDATPDFVIFWTNLLDYLAGPTRQYVFHPATMPEKTIQKPKNNPLAPWLWSGGCALGLISALLFTRKAS